MGYYRNILSHNYRLCLCPSGPPTLYILKRLALREYCSFCIQPVLVPYGPTLYINPRPQPMVVACRKDIDQSLHAIDYMHRSTNRLIPGPAVTSRTSMPATGPGTSSGFRSRLTIQLQPEVVPTLMSQAG